MDAEVFNYPSTRYSGSKRRFLEWIWWNISGLKFESVLDVFGGTGSVSLLFKRKGKRVHYNDLLKFNEIIGTALVENRNTVVTDDEIEHALDFRDEEHTGLVHKEFKGIFYPSRENKWIDKAVTKFIQIQDKYKRAILLSALFQACLAKRPFNLFHRANLYIRTNKQVVRSFGNKTTWERPFEELVRRYVVEYNKSVFNNGKKNRVIGGYDALTCPNGVDLVYLDPPYFSASHGQGTNYLALYHFLEGLANYDTWSENIGSSVGKTKRMQDPIEILRWIKKDEIHSTFIKLIDRFQDNIIVLSYQNDGIPSQSEIRDILKKYKNKVKIFSKVHQYALSSSQKKELLFVAV